MPIKLLYAWKSYFMRRNATLCALSYFINAEVNSCMEKLLYAHEVILCIKKLLYALKSYFIHGKAILWALSYFIHAKVTLCMEKLLYAH